jgi:DNA-binding CsgD family transcriptional regulator
MEPSGKVTIIGSPGTAALLQHWVRSGPHPLPCHLFGARDDDGDPFGETSTIALIAPQRWRDLAFWLPCLQQRFSAHTWLLFADLRLAGMFMSALEKPLCTLVTPDSAADRLSLSLLSLRERVALCPPRSLVQLIACGAPAFAECGGTFPTRMEIQCGCAASLGLSNRQIARVLRLCEGTVKNHLHGLLKKLNIADREELGIYLEQALTPIAVTPCRMKPHLI